MLHGGSQIDEVFNNIGVDLLIGVNQKIKKMGLVRWSVPSEGSLYRSPDRWPLLSSNVQCILDLSQNEIVTFFS